MCTFAINPQFNGIEINFENKPSAAIREAMKSAGFRWHSMKKLWYAKHSDERLALAQRLAGGEDLEHTNSGTVSAAGTSSGTETRAQSEPVSRYGVKVGDILADSWGYSMTIVEFYKVTRIVSPTKIEIVELGLDAVEGSQDSGGGQRVLPALDREIGERITKQIVNSRGSWYIKINESVHLTPWSGHALYENHFD